MSITYYKCHKIVTPHGVIDGALKVDGSTILDVVETIPDDGSIMDYSDYTMIPGIIDMHNHGFAGWSMTDKIQAQDVYGYTKALPSVGVTMVMPTAKPQAFKAIVDVIEAHDNIHTRIHGIHFEGPFWARGGENTVGETWPQPSIDLTKEYIDLANGHLKEMAIAPELNGADQVIRYLHENHIKVAACHTKASGEEIIALHHRLGLDIVTHLCNGMDGIHHRHMGALGGFLLLDDIYYELIADLNHVSATMIDLIFKIIDKSRICLISDSNYMANMPTGSYERYGKTMVIDEHGLIKDQHGRICGSGKYVLFDMYQLYTHNHVGLVDLCRMASTNPAIYLGIQEDYGSLQGGRKADFVLIDDQFNACYTYINGQCVYDHNHHDDLINPKAYSRKLS